MSDGDGTGMDVDPAAAYQSWKAGVNAAKPQAYQKLLGPRSDRDVSRPKDYRYLNASSTRDQARGTSQP